MQEADQNSAERAAFPDPSRPGCAPAGSEVRPLRARKPRQPPPKLLGEVGVADGIETRRNTSSCVRHGPLSPGPSPPLRGRKENSIVDRRTSNCAGGAPSGLVNL